MYIRLKKFQTAHGNDIWCFLYVCLYHDSSRPHTALLPEDATTDKNLTSRSPQKSPANADGDSFKRQDHYNDKTDTLGDGVVSLIYHSTDFVASPINDDLKVWL